MKARPLTLQSLALLAAVVLGASNVAHADQRPTLLLEAAEAWEKAQLNKAAELYEAALENGGLYPADVLVAYARIGTVRAAMNRPNEALSYFRVAAALDPSFELPSQAGRKARRIYRQVRKNAGQQGEKLRITAQMPTRSAPGGAFTVVAHVAEAFTPLIVNVGITVQDPSISTSTLKPWTTRKPANTRVEFDVPGKVVMAGANLLVRVDALDSHGNRWASAQARVKVVAQARADHALANSSPSFGDEPTGSNKEGAGGFWASQWPWIIGGAIIVGGTAAYFMSRPSDDVTVNAPVWK